MDNLSAVAVSTESYLERLRRTTESVFGDTQRKLRIDLRTSSDCILYRWIGKQIATPLAEVKTFGVNALLPAAWSSATSSTVWSRATSRSAH